MLEVVQYYSLIITQQSEKYLAGLEMNHSPAYTDLEEVSQVCIHKNRTRDAYGLTGRWAVCRCNLNDAGNAYFDSFVK